MKQNKRISRKKIEPFTPVYIGKKQLDNISIQLFEYNKDAYKEIQNYSLSNLTGFSDSNKIYWLNLNGIHDAELITEICKKLDIHNLIIEDILDTHQRTKFQEFEHYWFFTMKSILPSTESEIKIEQISYILGKNYLISFQENKAGYFEHIRHRIRKNVGIVRERSCDYLLYLHFEAILDNYFKTAESIESQLNDINNLYIKKEPSPSLIFEIEEYKRRIQMIIKTLSPIKDFITIIERERFSMIDKKHIKYYLELKDQCLQLTDLFDKMISQLDSNTNLFFSIQGHRMNQIMKVLTIITSIFIPLTFVAGIYGMNFKYIPELEWHWGYYFVLIFMFILALSLIVFFRIKKWF